MEKSVVSVLVLLALSACSSSPKIIPGQATQPAASVINTKAEASNDAHVGSLNNAQVVTLSQKEIESKKMADQLQDMQKKSVYFDFDKYAVEPAFLKIVQQQADFIKEHGNVTVTLQGNADERGSDEYNLALGERRANAVRKSLLLSGIPENKIKTVSLGEEKPRLTCHEETCWKENRRADFVYNPNP